MKPETTMMVASNTIDKGRRPRDGPVAGIQAAKSAAALLPMSHPVLVGNTHVNFTIGDTFIEVEVSIDTIDRTGVEMEAMTAVTVAASRSTTCANQPIGR
jgi:cyclic pyranopterin phosphate synthase